MKLIRQIVFVIGALLIVGSCMAAFMSVWHQTALAKAVDAYDQAAINQTQQAVTSVSTALQPTTVSKVVYVVATQTPVETTTQIFTPTPAFTPTPTPKPPLVMNYDLNGIDLSSGNPLVLTINLPSGSQLQTNWAGTIPYSGTDDPEKVFSPAKGVIYSYVGDVTTTWAHSGRNKYSGQLYFASNLDLYLRTADFGSVVSMAEANARANNLKGATAELCQTAAGTVKLLTDYNEAQCPGKVIKLQLVAAAIIPHEMQSGYDSHFMNINDWLTTNFPDAGFDQLNQQNGWLIRFCVGKFADQVSDGTPGYLYNRGVIGFRIVDGSMLRHLQRNKVHIFSHPCLQLF